LQESRWYKGSLVQATGALEHKSLKGLRTSWPVQERKDEFYGSSKGGGRQKRKTLCEKLLGVISKPEVSN